MRWVNVAVVAVAACGYRPPPKQTAFPTLDPDDTYNTRVADLRSTLGRAGIGLRLAGRDETFSTTNCDITSSVPNEYCGRCDLADKATHFDGGLVEATTRAFAKYPATALVATNIELVAVCNRLVYAKPDGVETPGGLADTEGHSVLLSMRSYRDGNNYDISPSDVGDIVHHEVYHHIDTLREDGDPEWDRTNPVGFTYDASAKGDDRRAGFVNTYAMSAAREDKASTYEFLMTKSMELCAQAKTEEGIRKKTQIIWKRAKDSMGTDSFMRDAAPCVDWLD